MAYIIEITAKGDNDVAAIALEFENEMLAQAVRYQIYLQTHTIREILMAFDMATSKTEEVVHAEVSSFVVAGNNIIYLGCDHILYEINLSDRTKTTVGKNIAEFAYNGKLWIQNNEKIYSKSLDKKAIMDCSFGIQCNRLLGITGIQMLIESEDGIYACDIETNMSRKIAEGIFVGVSDEKLLIYNSSDNSYQVIELY